MKIEILNESKIETIETELIKHYERWYFLGFAVLISISKLIGSSFEMKGFVAAGFAIELIALLIGFGFILNKTKEVNNKIDKYKESYELFKSDQLERLEFNDLKNKKNKIPTMIFKDKNTGKEIKKQYSEYKYKYEEMSKDKIIVNIADRKIKLSSEYINHQ